LFDLPKRRKYDTMMIQRPKILFFVENSILIADKPKLNKKAAEINFRRLFLSAMN